MAEPFDSLLKKALMEAMDEDLRDLPEDRQPMSDRQRRRMERLLENPEVCRGSGKRRSFSERGKRRGMLRFTAAAAAVAVLATTAIAHTVGGGFLREMFLRRGAENRKYAAYMNADQLLQLGSESVGTVVETEALRLELIDAVCSGNTAMAAIRVTAKQMVNFPQDGGAYRNYGFLEVSDSISEGNEAFGSNWRYVFSDKDPELADNECFLILSITSRSRIPEDTYTISLGDFGWQTPDEQEVLLPGSWELPVRLNGENQASRTIPVNAELTLEGNAYLLEEAVATPLTLTMEFTCESKDPDCPDRLMEALTGLLIGLADGTELDSQHFTTLCAASGADGQWKLDVGLEFFAPLPAGAIQCLSIGGQTLEFPLLTSD